MTVEKLHQITGKLIAKGRGDIPAAINIATFAESENGSILEVDAAIVIPVQGADDSGPVGPKCPMLVLTGGFTA